MLTYARYLIGWFWFLLFFFLCWETWQQMLYCNRCSLRNQIKRIIYLCTDSFSTQGSNTFDIKFIFFYYTRLNTSNANVKPNEFRLGKQKEKPSKKKKPHITWLAETNFNDSHSTFSIDRQQTERRKKPKFTKDKSPSKSQEQHRSSPPPPFQTFENTKEK